MVEQEVSLPFLHDLFAIEFKDERIQILSGVDPPQLKLKNNWRVSFSVSCHCGTLALLYIDIDKGKSVDEVRKATPQLLKGLSAQADQFQRMSCDLHRKMRLR